jgi:hypothetical protein
MHSNRYKLLGYAVWHGGKWYLRRRLPSRRKLALAGAGALLASGAGLALLKRMSG